VLLPGWFYAMIVSQQFEDIEMAITSQDEENYGSELIDMTKRAAVEALAPEFNALRQENQQLRHLQQRQQRAEIERALDARVPGWHEIYQNPRFAEWLASPDDYSAASRSQLLRNAVSNGDAARVVAIYRGFQQGQPQYRSRQSRQPAITGKIYGRGEIRQLYEQRRLGAIPDAKWGPIEADIVKAAAEGRVVGAVSDGTELSRWAR
jgi:hypothetical protein